jgi:hypothetical protein
MSYPYLSVNTASAITLFVFAFAVQAMASHELLKCDVYSYGLNFAKDENGELRIRPLSVQGRVRDGQAKLKGSASDVRPVENGIPQKLFAPEPVPSPIQYEAVLIDGKISIHATAEIGSGEQETFSITRPAAPEVDGQFPGVTLRARLKSTLEPELRFDDSKTDRFEIQCLHMPAHE